MKSIWKFPIDITDEQILDVPIGWKPLTIMSQHGQLCIWAEVDVMAKQQVIVSVLGTGNPRTGIEGEYIGSVITGPFVWHIYWRQA